MSTFFFFSFFRFFDKFRLAMDNELGLGTRGEIPCMEVGIGSPFTSLLMFSFTSFGVRVGLACGYDAVQRSIAMSGCGKQVAKRDSENRFL